MKLTRQQVLDLLSRAKAAGHLPSDGPTSLFVAQKRGKPVQLAVAVTDSKIVVRQSRLPFSRPKSTRNTPMRRFFLHEQFQLLHPYPRLFRQRYP